MKYTGAIQAGWDPAEQRDNAFLLFSVMIAIALHGMIWMVEIPETSPSSAGGAVAFTVQMPAPKPAESAAALPSAAIEHPLPPVERVEVEKTPVTAELVPVAEPVIETVVEPVLPPEPAPPVEVNREPIIELVAEPIPEPTPEPLAEPTVEPAPEKPVVELQALEAPEVESPVVEQRVVPVVKASIVEPPPNVVPETVSEMIAIDLPRPMAKPQPVPRPVVSKPLSEPEPDAHQDVAEQIAEAETALLAEVELTTETADAAVIEMAVLDIAEDGTAADELHEDVSSQSNDDLALVTKPVFARPPVPPEYPRVSQRRYEEGTVVFRVLVSSVGKSEEVKVWQSSGFNRLDVAAESAVWKWHFAPARKAGVPVRSWVEIPVNFYLN